MKKFFLPLALFAFSALLITGCKKDDSSTSTPAPTDFSPTTAGSNWTYQYTERNTPPEVFKLTASNRDTVVNGKNYRVILNDDGSTGTYLAHVGHDYYRLASFPSLDIQSFEELYLKDDKNVNDTWAATASITLSGFNLTANLGYTIKGKGESRTVSGKAFDNVTHVRLDISLGTGSVGGGDFYYQAGVGLIEANISVTPPIGSAYTSSQVLTAYEIK
jgi:hypothetical protein